MADEWREVGMGQYWGGMESRGRRGKSMVWVSCTSPTESDVLLLQS